MRNKSRPRATAINVPDKVILEVNSQKETLFHQEADRFGGFYATLTAVLPRRPGPIEP
ncbi:MAG: hypothetical protein ACO1RA_14300 [Planctomycetaceae bacterium]